MTPEKLMHCDEVDAQLDAYLTNALDSASAEAIEHHVSSCVRCEARLEAATRLDTASFAPPLPVTVRERTLVAVANAARVAPAAASPLATWSRRAAGVAAIAALALVYVKSSREAPATAPDSVASISIGTPSNAIENDAASSGARTMAREQAASEFRSLDAAAQELEAVLRATPSDPDVQAYLDAVKARRAELADKVAEAAS